jgi:hypothetical protein
VFLGYRVLSRCDRAPDILRDRERNAGVDGLRAKVRRRHSRSVGLILAVLGLAACGGSARAEIWHCTITTDPMGLKGAAFVFDREARTARVLHDALPPSYAVGLPRHRRPGDVGGGTGTGRHVDGTLECLETGCYVRFSEPVGSSRWQFFIPEPAARDVQGQPIRAWFRYEILRSGFSTDEYGYCTKHGQEAEVQPR